MKSNGELNEAVHFVAAASSFLALDRCPTSRCLWVDNP